MMASNHSSARSVISALSAMLSSGDTCVSTAPNVPTNVTSVLVSVHLNNCTGTKQVFKGAGEHFIAAQLVELFPNGKWVALLVVHHSLATETVITLDNFQTGVTSVRWQKWFTETLPVR